VSDQGFIGVERWITDRLIPADDALRDAVERTEANRLPAIQVDPTMGKLLNLLARMIGAQRILEIGTLAGYSTIWLARALPADGKLITLEYDPKHARVAEQNIAEAGFGDLVDLRVGPALDELPRILEAGEGPFDLVFIDADKANQDRYLAFALDLTRVGSVIIGDNIVRGGRTLTDPDNPGSQGMERFMQILQSDPRIDATVIQTVGSKSWDGFALGLVVEPQSGSD
jgi:predicted O-methyltransferase YrrM